MKKYPVVTLCGSTRFKDDFMQIQKELTLKGYIVISIGLFGHGGDAEVWEGMDENSLTATKMMLDDMHKSKIDMADEIFVVNPGSYIGNSTWSEICYAYMTGKKINSLVPIDIKKVAGKAQAAEKPSREKVEKDVKWYCTELNMPLPQGFPDEMSNEEMQDWLMCWHEFDPCPDV